MSLTIYYGVELKFSIEQLVALEFDTCEFG